MLAIRFTESAKLLGPFVLLWVAFRDRFDGWAATAWIALLVLVATERVSAVVYDWYAVTFAFDGQVLRHRRGLVRRLDVAVRAKDVAAVQISQPWAHRVVGSVQVSVGVGAGGTQRVVLDAVRPEFAEAIVAWADGLGAGRCAGGTPAPSPPPVPPVPPIPPVPPVPPVTTTLYRIARRDYVLVALAYGEVFLVVPFAANAAAELGRWVELGPVLSAVGAAVPGWFALMVAVSAACLAGLGYGCLRSWLSYRGYHVRMRGGDLLIDGGLLTRETRAVPSRHLSGVRIDEPPMLRLLRSARLSLLSREPGQQRRANVVFPVVARRALRDATVALLPEIDSAVLHLAPRGRVRVAALAAAGGAAAITYALTRLLPAWAGHELVAVLATALVLVVVLDACWAATCYDEERDVVVVRTGVIAVRRYAVRRDCVHAVHTRQGPLTRATGLAGLCVLVHAGTAVHLRVPLAETELALRVVDALTGPRRRSHPVPT